MKRPLAQSLTLSETYAGWLSGKTPEGRPRAAVSSRYISQSVNFLPISKKKESLKLRTVHSSFKRLSVIGLFTFSSLLANGDNRHQSESGNSLDLEAVNAMIMFHVIELCLFCYRRLWDNHGDDCIMQIGLNVCNPFVYICYFCHEELETGLGIVSSISPQAHHARTKLDGANTRSEWNFRRPTAQPPTDGREPPHERTVLQVQPK